MIQEKIKLTHQDKLVKSSVGGRRVTRAVGAIILHVALTPAIVTRDVLHIAAATASTALSRPPTTTPASGGRGGGGTTLVYKNIRPLPRPVDQRIIQPPKDGQTTMTGYLRVQQLCNSLNLILGASLDPRQDALQDRSESPRLLPDFRRHALRINHRDEATESFDEEIIWAPITQLNQNLADSKHSFAGPTNFLQMA